MMMTRHWKVLLLLFIFGTGLSYVTTRIQTVPGYMDAEYYYSVSKQIISGNGWAEPFLWNYIDSPAGLPHQANTYWMPLVSFAAAAGMWLAGNVSFSSSRWIFVALAGLIPVMAYTINFKLTQNEILAKFAGLFSLFSGFYVTYLSLTDSFLIYMLLGSLTIITVSDFYDLRSGDGLGRGKKLFLIGLLTGLMHLTRADGITWFLAILLGEIIYLFKDLGKKRVKSQLLSIVFLVLGYFSVTAFWYLRNWFEFHSFSVPGSGSMIWLTSYNQTFSFLPLEINFQNWLAAGIGNYWDAVWVAIKMNLANMLAVQGSIFLILFIAIGIWIFRKNRLIKFTCLAWGLNFIVMTFVFPFAGARGGFLHTGAATQLIFWALIPIGLEQIILWGKEHRNWNYPNALKNFGSLFLCLAFLFTSVVYLNNVIGDGNFQSPGWEQSTQKMLAISNYLKSQDVDQQDVVMINNPPGYYYVSEGLSIVIPDNNPAILFEAVKKYQVKVVVLEENHPVPLDDLYNGVEKPDWLKLIGMVEDAKIYEVID